jgi:hypothetical protein
MNSTCMMNEAHVVFSKPCMNTHDRPACREAASWDEQRTHRVYQHMHAGHVLAVKEKEGEASRRGTQCFDEQVTTQQRKRR